MEVITARSLVSNLREQEVITEPQETPVPENLVSGDIDGSKVEPIMQDAQEEGGEGGEGSLERPLSPAAMEPTDAAAGDEGKVCRDSSESSVLSRQRCGSLSSSSSSSSNNFFEKVDSFLESANEVQSETSHKPEPATNDEPRTSRTKQPTHEQTAPARQSSQTQQKRPQGGASFKQLKAQQQDSVPLKFTLQLAFQTIGVVFGDLGTSPLYVYDSTFTRVGAHPSKDNVLGALSLIIYTLTLVPLIKYIFIVLKANDNGNGEVFALYSLICRIAGIKVGTYQMPDESMLSTGGLVKAKNRRHQDRADWIKGKLRKSRFWQQVLLVLALFGTCAVIGDGILTPSISVLWAMSGIRTNFPSTSESTMTYCSAGVLVILFCLQRFGTDRVSFLFSPVLLIWFLCTFLIGTYNIHYYPAVFKAFNPYYIYLFFERNKKRGWISLAGIVLAMTVVTVLDMFLQTGTEAMVADLGHFSVASIQIAFSGLVYPSLLAAYIGQAAYLIHDPSVVGATFYKSIPRPVFWPMLVIAIATAIIASQAMIKATFCIIEQCMALGCFPTCKILHTSKKFKEQIYIPEVNWILMVLTVAVTVGFRTPEQIGDAYGLAVVSVMTVTTCFLTLIIIMVWLKSLLIAGTFWTVCIVLETVYYSSVLYKVPQGGWVPVPFVAVVFGMMYTWHYGRKHRYIYEVEHKIAMDWVLGLGSSFGVVRVSGVGIIYSELAHGVPSIFVHVVSNLKAMHSVLVFVCIKYLPVPHVPEEERLLVCRLGPKHYHMYRIIVRYGYAELKDADVDFEKQLFDSLASYVQTEGSQPRQEVDSEENGTEASTTNVDDIDKALEQTSGQFRVEFSSDNELGHNGWPGVELPYNNSALDVEEDTVEMALLEQSRHAGVVHVIGHTEVRARQDSSSLRRFVIDHAYDILRQNCRGNTVGLNIPSTRLLQIGMLHYI